MSGVLKNTRVPHAEMPSSCSFCMIHSFGLCNAAAGMPHSGMDRGFSRIQISRHSVRNRRIIRHSKELPEFVIVICSGQAVSSIVLPDGRQQVLEILLPGDTVFWTAVREPVLNRQIEAVDECMYRKLSRSEFRSLLFEHRELLEKFVRTFAQQKAQSDQLALTLGRRSGDERIARLIVNLADRLTERDLMVDQTMRFQLRLRHIGDATGLTPVHAGKILNQFQRNNLISLHNRFLTINDSAELRQIAGL